MKRHPVLVGFLIIGILFVVFLFAIFLTLFLSGQMGALPLGEKIAVVLIEGNITESRAICEKIIQYRKSKQVKGIVLRINSPGGSVGPSQEIFKEVVRFNEVKKVVASMGAIAASGGYYIACGAEKIVANPGTITGSIGVLVQIPNIERFLEKIGLSHEVIKSGKHKDMGSITRKMTEEENRLMQEVIDDVHDQFVSVVSERRGLPKDKVKAIADGRIFSGRQALELGLVDHLGNLQDAIDLAAKLAGIEGEPAVIYPRKKDFSLIDLLIGKKYSQIFDRLKDQISPIPISYLFDLTLQ